MVERQVTRWMGRMLGTIAWADVAVLADVAGDHPLGQAGPSRVRMDVMVGTDARQPRMLAAASGRSARDHAADGAELHPGFVGGSEARLTLVTLNCRPFDIAARAWARSTLRSIPLRCYGCGTSPNEGCALMACARDAAGLFRIGPLLGKQQVRRQSLS